MELFRGRTLSLFCLIFIAVSMLCRRLESDIITKAIAVSLIAAVIVFVILFFIRSHRIGAIAVILCIISVSVALSHTLFSVCIPAQKAAEYTGDKNALIEITSVEQKSQYFSKYQGYIKLIDGEAVDIRTELTFDFSADISVGDSVYGYVKLEEWSSENYINSSGVLLSAYLYDGKYSYVHHFDGNISADMLMTPSGREIAAYYLSLPIKELLLDGLDGEIGALACGFLSGDRSELSDETVRDFRRSGVSHMMAVSGLHVSVILGTVELLLRKLYVPKPARCIGITLLGIVFWAITGFSLSALRALLMLWALYINYMIGEDGDSVTVLFVSVALIILFSPYAATDIGLWMSFLATLGIITVYTELSRTLPKFRYSKKQRIRATLFRLLRRIILIAIMTLVASMFILPIQWMFFHEFSVVSVLANIILSPLATLFLYCICLFLLISSIPFVSDVLGAVTEIVGEAITDITGAFSAIPNATVSLNYGFAAIIVIAFSVISVIMLAVRINKKWLWAVPTALAVVSYTLCFFIFNFVSEPVFSYQLYDKKDEMIFVEDNGELAVCDISSGDTEAYYKISEYMIGSTATEIRSFTLTHYHYFHEREIDRLCSEKILRTIYMPVPRSYDEADIAKEIWECAKEHGTETVFYDIGQGINILDSVYVYAYSSEEESGVVLSLLTEESSLLYFTPQILNTDVSGAVSSVISESKTVIIGTHGLPNEGGVQLLIEDGAKTERIVFSSEAMRSYCTVYPNGANLYSEYKGATEYKVSFKLDN